MSAGQMLIQRGAGQIPPELLRSVPREVVLRTAGKALVSLTILLLLFAMVDPWIYVAAKRDAARFKLLEDESVLTQAEVIALGPVHDKESRRGVTYRYQSAGQTHSGQAELRRQEWRGLRTGSLLAVRCVPSQPTISWLPGHEPRGTPLWAVPLVPSVNILVAFLIMRALRRQRSLLAHGRGALAQVTKSAPVRKGDHRVHRVHYEFKILSGATRTGRYDVQKNPPSAGSSLVVLYDPDQPERNVRYPLPLVTVATSA